MKNRTKLIIRILLLAGTAISLYFVPWPIVSAWLKPLPATVQVQVDEAIDMGFDGIIVYVDSAGIKSTVYTAGYHNREEKIPADPQALFKIASVGKLYNALAVAKLVRSGKLSLKKTLSDYLPALTDRIENADRITLRMLVQHRSGIPNYTDINNYWAAPKETDEEKLALILDLPANFEPGEDYAYSNTNYLLLVRIMESVLGHPPFQYIRKEILEPLNLRHTYSSVLEVNSEKVMSGYYVGYPPNLKSDNVGSMLATAENVGRFIRALNDGSVFVDQKEREIYTSLYRFGHTGLIPGYQTIAKYHPDMDRVVVQFTNTVDFEGYNWSLSEIEYSRIVKILEKQK